MEHLFSALRVIFVVWVTVSYVLAFVTTWLRKDWEHAFKVATTILLIIPGVFFAPLTLVVYGLFDVISRPRLDRPTKAVWSIVMIVSLSIGVLPYQIWVIRRCGSSVPPPGPATDQGSRDAAPGELTREDLDYLRTLADLRDRGVLSDDEYEEQRRRRLGS